MLDIRDTDRIRIITLNRPEALNAFNEALYDATTEALIAAAADPTVAVVVITGTRSPMCTFAFSRLRTLT